MKLLILVAFVAVSAAASYDSSVRSVVYKPGEEYVYHYKGQVLSGIPKASMQFAGLLLDTRVHLQFQHENKVVMKLDNIKLFKINNKITTLPSEPLTEGDMTHLTGEQAKILKEFLVRPLKFKYVEGDIREIEKESHDRFWSINIKKGILSLFQVTLKEKRSLSDSLLNSDSLKPSLRSISSSSNPLLPSWRHSKINTVHKVMEADVTGDCETKYTVVHDMTRSASTMHVTAVRNFENCLNKPFYIEGLFQGVNRYEEEKDLMQPLVHVDYVITGDRTHFLIKDAVLRGKYFFMPTGLEGGDMSSYVYQKLTLEHTVAITTPFRLNNPKPETKGLLMIIPKASVLTESRRTEEMASLERPLELRRVAKESKSEEDKSTTDEDKPTKRSVNRRVNREESEEEVKGSIRERNYDNVVSVIETKLTEMVECLYPSTDKKCSDILFYISRIMREVSKEELKPLLSRYLKRDSDTDYRKSQILLDILPTLPSHDAGHVLVELIRERHISEFRGSIMIKRMSLEIKPTPSLIKAVFELFKELPKDRTTALSSRMFLRQASLLCVGTLTHRLITVMHMHGKPIPHVISFLDTISSEMKQLLEGTTEDLEKILILKSMGNMGTNELIPTLKRLVEDRQLTLKVRVSAVFALRRLCKQYKKLIVPVMMGVLMDVNDVREVRQAAFVVIINSNPSYITLQMIAHLLRNEPSSQIRTLIYSTLVNLALYTHHEPEHKLLKENARLVIKTIPAISIGVHDTMSVLISKFSDDLDLGGAFNFMKIKSRKSGLPAALIANFQGTLFGKHRRLFEFGAEGKGLETLLKKVFGPYGLLKDIFKGKISLQEFLKPLIADMGGIEHKIKDLLKKSMIELEKDEEPVVSWYVHLLGNELQYIIVNSENINEITNKVHNIASEWLNKMATGLKVDLIKSVSHISTLTIACPLGVPLSLNFTTMSIFKVDGHVKVSHMPTWSELYRFPITIPKLNLEVDLKPTIDMSHHITLGADMRWLTTSVGIEMHLKTTLPTKMDILLDRPQHTFSIKSYLPKKVVKFYSIVTPITRVKYIPTTMDKLPFTMETKEITNDEIVKIIPFETKYKCVVTSLEVEVRGQYCVCGPVWCPTVPLFGKSEITLLARPTSEEYVKFKIHSLKTNFDLEGVPASLRSKELYDSSESSESVDREDKRGRRPRPIRTDEFDMITPDSIFTDESMKRQILITFGTPAPETPTIKTLITWLMDKRYWKHQLNVQFVRPTTSETPGMKVQMNKVINLSTIRPESVYESSKGELICKTHMFWTMHGIEQDIKMKFLAGSSIDILRELKELSIFTADNLPKAVAQKYKFTWEAEFKHLSKRTLKYITIVQDFIKYNFYKYLTINLPEEVDMKKITVAVEVMPKWEQMNVVMKTPREDSYFAGVPFYWNPFLATHQKIRLHDQITSSYYRNSTTKADFLDTVPYKHASLYRDECLVNHREHEVITFDGSTIPTNSGLSNVEKGCWTLLTQDCSEQGLFTIVSKSIRDGRIFKLLVPKYEIELVVKDNVIMAKINDEEKTLQLSRPLLIKKEREESSATLYKIEKLHKTLFEVKAYELGITLLVDTEKRTTKIKVSPMSMLQGQLCGLCGNNNQDQSDEFDIPNDLEENRSVHRLRLTHVVPSETCDVDRREP